MTLASETHQGMNILQCQYRGMDCRDSWNSDECYRAFYLSNISPRADASRPEEFIQNFSELLSRSEFLKFETRSYQINSLKKDSSNREV